MARQRPSLRQRTVNIRLPGLPTPFLSTSYSPNILPTAKIPRFSFSILNLALLPRSRSYSILLLLMVVAASWDWWVSASRSQNEAASFFFFFLNVKHSNSPLCTIKA